MELYQHLLSFRATNWHFNLGKRCLQYFQGTFLESEVPKNIILNKHMTSTSAFFQMCHHFFGIGAPSNTVFGLTLNLRMDQDGHQTFKNNAMLFDMS